MNLSTSQHLLHLLTLLLLLQKSLSHVNPHYTACKPFLCGNLNISYPFYVPDKQPSFCGSTGFQVSCNRKFQTIINISNDDYIINNISYNDLSINITNYAFSSPVFSCLSSVHNLTLGQDTKLINSSYYHHKELILLQDCSGNIASNKNYTTIKCKEDDKADDDHHTLHAVYKEDDKGDDDHTLHAVYKEDFRRDEVGNCSETVVVPYEQAENDIIGIQGMLRSGIILDYSANNCSECQMSGGRCGINPNISQFFCFCPDRDHTGSCHSPKAAKGKHLKINLGTVLLGSAIFFLALIVYCLYRRQRKSKSGSSTLPIRSMSFARMRLDREMGSMNGVTVFSYTELEEATNNFDPTRQLGEGGFGVVYHGILRDGREVAVKRLFEKSYKRIEQFKNEIRILTDLRHQNLVTLYGCTSRHTRELLLVYEYITNGTVADHLHGDQAESKLLPWSTRLSISIEIATALSYLHFKDIVHRDVKTNNILLDNSFSVKVADFGLSRLFPADVTHVSTAPQGTPGYVDPEYHQCYHLTDKSDVYSFGVVLIELISSLPAVDVGRQRHEINLSTYAMIRIQSSALSALVDPKLGFETDFKIKRMITLVAELASQCLQHERELRPSMEEVKETLKRIESEDYDALEAEETDLSMRAAHIMKPTPLPTDNGNAELLRNNRQQPASPVSVMDKWLNSSKFSTPNTSRSS